MFICTSSTFFFFHYFPRIKILGQEVRKNFTLLNTYHYSDCFFIYFERERDRETESVRGERADRKEERESQAGSMLSVQS